MTAMTIHDVTQGSPEWLALRRTHFTASEAAAMMGCSPYMTRDELLRAKATGEAEEITAEQQRLFDSGHRTEAAFRPHAAALIGDDLFPITGSRSVEGLPLLASFDGLTMGHEVGYEHKLWNADLVRTLEANGEPGPAYYWQLEQQLLVSGAGFILFCVSDGTAEKAKAINYASIPERRAALIAGWKQFAADLAAWKPAPAAPVKPTGAKPSALMALQVQARGDIVSSNLPDFKAYALEVIGGINKTLSTDQDFADAEEAVKWCAAGEERIAATRAAILGQMVSVDEATRMLDDVAAALRRTRLDLGKLVEARKQEIRDEIAGKAQAALVEHVAGINAAFPRPYVPLPQADFYAAMKGKRTIDTLQAAANSLLANAKAQANSAGQLVRANLDAFALAVPKPQCLLFADLAALVLKPAEDFAALVQARLQQHAAEVAQHAAEVAAAEARAQAEREAQQHAAQAAQFVPVSEYQGKVPDGAHDIGSIHASRIANPSPADDGALCTLGQLQARLRLPVTAMLLEDLGFAFTQRGPSRMYRVAAYPAIVDALIRHLQERRAVAPVAA